MIRLRQAILVAGVAVSLGLVLPAPLRAQATAADTAAVLLRVATELEQQGRRELAEGLLAFIRQRYPGTPSAAEVERRLSGLRRARVDRGGRAELVVWSTLGGLWLGIALPAAAKAEGPTPYGLGLLLGGPAGFFLSKSYAESRPMSTGQARTIALGARWGWWQIWGWREAFGGLSAEDFFTSTVVGMLGGTVVGAVIARNADISGGDATLVGHAAVWGSWFGVASSVLFDVHGESIGLKLMLAGGDLGLVAALLATPRSNMSAGRVWLVSAAGLAGLVAGFGIDLIVQTENAQVGMGIPMATSVAGLAAGLSLTRRFDSASQGPDQAEPRPASALLSLKGGRLALGVPSPVPVLLPRTDERGLTRWTPGVRVTLFEAMH